VNISIFSKFEMAGGSEFRCAELANGIVRFTDNKAFILSDHKMPDKLLNCIDKKVNLIENCFLSSNFFYESDVIIIVNTDCKDFSTLDFWQGKSPCHNFSFDIDKLKNIKFFFLYNFIISPSRHLCQLSDLGIDVNIISTNKKFFDEVTKQDRYEHVRILPRYIVESPIDQNSLNIFAREPSSKICFGMHSKHLGNKWNNEIEKLIIDINKRYSKDKIEFRFMGIKADLRKKIEKIENVTCLKENEESVSDFLSTLDVFLFFPDWKREEPWARVIAEAMVSGCPVIALDKGGTKDQVLNYNNGFLCKRYNDYYRNIVYLMEHKELINRMSRNSLKISKGFYTEQVIKKLTKIMNY